jgi:hypothetical protein
MASFNGAIGSKPETPAERRERLARIEARERTRIAGLSDADKIELLAGDIVDVMGKHRHYCDTNALQRGFAESDARRIFDAAYRRAVEIDPQIGVLFD